LVKKSHFNLEKESLDNPTHPLERSQLETCKCRVINFSSINSHKLLQTTRRERRSCKSLPCSKISSMISTGIPKKSPLRVPHDMVSLNGLCGIKLWISVVPFTCTGTTMQVSGNCFQMPPKFPRLFVLFVLVLLWRSLLVLVGYIGVFQCQKNARNAMFQRGMKW
jgi:hypothetical protein